jgi:hypothetical protein
VVNFEEYFCNHLRSRAWPLQSRPSRCRTHAPLRPGAARGLPKQEPCPGPTILIPVLKEPEHRGSTSAPWVRGPFQVQVPLELEDQAFHQLVASIFQPTAGIQHADLLQLLPKSLCGAFKQSGPSKSKNTFKLRGASVAVRAIMMLGYGLCAASEARLG